MYEIGPFRLDPAAKVLLHGGAPVQLGTRAVDVLALLVERRNEHVPKSHILDAAWPGRVVEESNLNVQISAIRRVLARVPGGASWVETLPRRGYRFVGPVCRVPHTSDADRTETTLCSNLPAPLTAFIGRARETDEIEQLLSAARLLTLVGIGGIGKTRLAQRVAAERIELFLDRARLQRPHFHYDPALAPAIAGLCTQLDGIPLALELAAGRVRSLSVEQILERLGDRFRLLSAGARALPRQRTLLAALDWSYDLLTEQKRAVLRRCAIFSGGFTLEAAVRVAGDEILDAMGVTDLLGQLVGRSLVIADTDGPRARYHLLETARAYAFEKLAAAGEVDAARRAHSLFFRDLFARAPHDWLRMSDVEWRALYVPELDNVRAALDWALTARADVHAGVALA